MRKLQFSIVNTHRRSWICVGDWSLLSVRSRQLKTPCLCVIYSNTFMSGICPNSSQPKTVPSMGFHSYSEDLFVFCSVTEWCSIWAAFIQLSSCVFVCLCSVYLQRIVGKLAYGLLYRANISWSTDAVTYIVQKKCDITQTVFWSNSTVMKINTSY